MISIGRASKLTRIGVFYDGNYFLHVSNYYNYQHHRKARISIGGLHDFIRSHVAERESLDKRMCQIVDAHYFRGRLSAYEARDTNKLFPDRLFDDVLMSEGIVTHYLPIKSRNGRKEEKGIDVWLALEAYELAIHKQYDVLVFIASDGDYVPLIRKLNTLGVRVMVLSWDFQYTTESGKEMVTRTSQDLLEEVTYPVAMHALIDDRLRGNDPLINNIFVPANSEYNGNYQYTKPRAASTTEEGSIHAGVDDDETRWESVILNLNKNKGIGFISAPPNNLFFHFTHMKEGEEFNELEEGDKVEYVIGKNRDGEDVAREVRKLPDDDDDFYDDLDD